MKLQIPSSKFQRNSRLQISSEPGRAAIGIWNLKLLWNLELGTWSFSK
jgi:hypothetical protein